MGILGIIGSIIAFPFRLLFGRRKEREESLSPEPAQVTAQPRATLPTDTTLENLKAKIDMMMAQVDSLKLEYDAMNQRMQNMERMIREIYMIAKS